MKATAEVESILRDKWERLNTLYWIVNEEGQAVKFQMRAAQEKLFEALWYCNLVLKARQLGFTTFIDLYFLDECLFNSNLEAGIIAHKFDDAQKIFRRKIKYPYDHLPDALKDEIGLTTDSKSELQFTNGSVIYVDTSLRSATVQLLHISEYGKICRRFPDRAEEIKTGALNAIHVGQLVFIESTAEGMGGHFYELCMSSLAKLRGKVPLTPMDFKIHFFPWFDHPEYRLDDPNVVIPQHLIDYFDQLEAVLKIKLPHDRRAWYFKKWGILGEKIWQEFPSTPEEAFKASLEGAYYAKQFAKIYQDRRICRVHVESGYPVHTAWDLGMDDYTSIGFFQQIGREVRWVDFYENSGEGLEHYVKVLREKDYLYGTHFFPADVEVRELTLRESQGRTRKEFLEKLGLKVQVAPKLLIEDGIEAVRRMLAVSVFDESKCSELIGHLEAYTKEWDEKWGQFKNRPQHDLHSHAADMVRVAATGMEDVGAVAVPPSWKKLRQNRSRTNWRVV